MAGSSGRIGIEPDMWFLVFTRSTPHRWLSWLAMGRFKHVLAIGWIADQRNWLVYEVEIGRTRVAVLPDCDGAREMLADLRAGGETLAIPASEARPRWVRPGFWCVPAMAHLVGIRRAVFRPDALHRACLQQGAQVLDW